MTYPLLSLLCRAKLTVNSEKLTIASDTIQFLDHVFCNQSVSLHQDSVQPD